MNSTLRASSICLCFVILLMGRETFAQDVTGQIYKDVETIAEELISREAAHNLVPAIACLAPDTYSYYPRSLQRLYELRFADMKESLRQETGTAVAYVVYQGVSTGSFKGSGLLLRGVPLKKPAQIPTEADSEYVSQPLSTSYVIPSARVVDSSPERQESFESCKKEQATRFDAGSYTLGNSTADIATEFDRHCRQPASLADKFACPLARAGASLIAADKDGIRGHLIEASAVVVAARLRQSDKLSGLQIDDLSAAITTTIEAGLRGDQATGADLAKVLYRMLGSPTTENDKTLLVEVNTHYASIETFLTHWKVIAKSKSAEELLRTSASTLFGKAGLLLKGSTEARLCEASAPLLPICDELETIDKLSEQLAPIVRSVSEKHFGDAAVMVVRDIFPDCNDDSTDGPETACSRLHKYRRFAETVVSYAANAEEGSISAASSVAFRAATEDLIESAGQGGGIERSHWQARRVWKIALPAPQRGILYPQFSLSYSWSQGFVNESGPQGARANASFEFLNLIRFAHYRSTNVYWDFRLWLFDAIGPLSEIASRKTGTYGHSQDAWLLFVKPKLSFMIASPSLTGKHLGLSLFLSIRSAAAFPDANGGFSYHAIFDHLPDVQTPGYRFIESGASIIYLL